MKRFFLGVSFLSLLATAGANGGPSETFDKSTTASDTAASWYASREFNVQLWGNYAFTANAYRQNQAIKDRYLQSDHAWGGGFDAKYFFNRYVGVGLEGYAMSSTVAFQTISYFAPKGTTYPIYRQTRTIGAGLATITLRCPLGASRFAPYAFGGAGFIVGGAQVLRVESVQLYGTPPGTNPLRAFIDGTETEAIGQFGGGLEIRLTPHLGLINDFSWNVVNGRDNNFGMARTGINLAF